MTIAAINDAVVKQTHFDNGLPYPADIECLHVAYGLDANYIRAAGVAMVSLIKNNPAYHWHFHVFASSVFPEDLERFQSLVATYPARLTLYLIDAGVFVSLPRIAHYPLSTYFRLLMPLELAKNHVNRFLYMDPDIVCLGPIDKLVNSKMDGKIAAAAHDEAGVAAMKVSELSIAPHSYFNAGILLIDVPGWNSLQISEKVLALLADPPVRFSLMDQDALTLALRNQIQYLDFNWNFPFETYKKQKQPLKAPPIFLHFSGTQKPWKTLFRHSAQRLYLEFQDSSPWRDLSLDEPSNYKEMRLFSGILWSEGKYAASIQWYWKYLHAKLMKK